MNPLISVIMGVYNCANTLPSSIQSILDQDYSNFEFIICDDGSTDNTFAIVSDFAKKDSRIIALQNPKNAGLAPALNRCIQIANGEYLARMDGDDISLPQRFSKQIEFLQAHSEYAFCGTSLEFFDNTGVWGVRKCIEKPINRDFLSVSPFAHPTVIFRKTALQAVNGYKTEGVGRSEDYELFMRLYASNFIGYNLQEILFSYCEDRHGYAKRKLKFTFTEVKIRFQGYLSLKLMPIGLIAMFRPLVLGLLPASVRIYLHKKKYQGKTRD